MAKSQRQAQAAYEADKEWGLDEPPPPQKQPDTRSPIERRKAHEKAVGRRPELSERDYQERGFTRLGRGHPEQQEMLPHGSLPEDPIANPRTRNWSDLTGAERKTTTQKMSARYGVTLQSAAKEHGHLIDRGFRRSAVAHPEAENIEAEGQRWYAGGPGTAAEQVGKLARVHRIPFQTAAAMRAVVSPNAPAVEEVQAAHAAAEHVKAHPRSKYTHAPEKGEPGFIPGSRLIQQNIQKSAEIFRAAQEGRHPFEVSVEATARKKERRGQPALIPSGPKKGQPKIGPVLSGGKVTGYEPSYSLPRTTGRGAADRHAVKGMAPHLEMPEVEDMMDVPHAHAFFSEAMDRAAKKRGLGLAEGQTVAWHEKKYYERVPVEHGHGLHNPDQFEAVPAAKTRRLPKQEEVLTPREAARRQAVARVRPQERML